MLEEALLLVVAFCGVAMLILAKQYHDYLRFSDEKSKSRYFISSALIITIMVILITVTWFPALLVLLSIFLLFVLFCATFSIVLLNQLRFKCSKEEEREVNGVKFTVCYGAPLNAWYNHCKKRVFISDRLLDVLNDQEIKAVYYHEEGHKVYHVILHASSLVARLWLLVISALLATYLGHVLGLINVSLPVFLFILGISILLTCLFAFLTVFWSWINEHEADVYASRKANPSSLISALIKHCVHECLESEEVLLRNLNVTLDTSQISSSVKEYGFGSVFKLLLKTSVQKTFDVLGFLEAFKRPLPPTHPPLGLRIYKILNASSR